MVDVKRVSEKLFPTSSTVTDVKGSEVKGSQELTTEGTGLLTVIDLQKNSSSLLHRSLQGCYTFSKK